MRDPPRRWQARLTLWLLLAPALLWLGALIVLPHVDLAMLSLRERIGPAPIRAEPRAVPDLFHRAAVLACVRAHRRDVGRIATLLTLLVAFPIAWIIAKLARGRASSLLFIVCLIPFWVSETVRTLGWMILLRESGVLPALLVKLGITACRSSCSTTTRPSWSAWSTPRCCSWSCRWSPASRASTTR
jgi:spermidine/putrescine transport system permease protein